MGPLDRGFENALELRPAEVIRWSGPAMHRVRRVWLGGRIYLTDQRLFFCPGVLSRGRCGVLRIPLGEITGVEVLDRRFAPGAVGEGGLRRRLQITTAAGERHAFSMQAFTRRTRELRALLASDRAGRG